MLLAGVALTLLVHRPDGYQPVAPDNPDIVSPYLTHQLGPDFYNQVQLDKPFELIVTEEGLNDILSREPWPMDYDGLLVSMPTVRFGEGQISLMAGVDYKGFASVVTVLAMPALDAEGKLNLNIQAVWLGALPVTPLAKAIAERVAEPYLPTPTETADPTRQAVEAMLSNRPFEPVLPIGDFTVRLEALSLEPGRARLRLAPVE